MSSKKSSQNSPDESMLLAKDKLNSSLMDMTFTDTAPTRSSFGGTPAPKSAEQGRLSVADNPSSPQAKKLVPKSSASSIYALLNISDPKAAPPKPFPPPEDKPSPQPASPSPGSPIPVARQVERKPILPPSPPQKQVDVIVPFSTSHIQVDSSDYPEPEEMEHFQPTSLDTIEKPAVQARRQTMGKMSLNFQEAYKNMEAKTVPVIPQTPQTPSRSINAQSIKDIAKARFSHVQTASKELPKETSAPIVSAPLQQQTMHHFVQKFGFVEINEIDTMLAEKKSQEKGLYNISEEEEGDHGDLHNDSPQHSEQSPVSKPSKLYFEDILDVPLLTITPMEGVNTQLPKDFQATVCAFFISPRNSSKGIFGTESGEIFECTGSMDKNTLKKHSLDSKITAVTLSPNEEYFVAGSQNSELLFRKTEGKVAKKQLKSLNQQKITQIVFANNNLLLVGTMFNVYSFNILVTTLNIEVAMGTVLPRQQGLLMQIGCQEQDGGTRAIALYHDKIHFFNIVRNRAEDKKDLKEPVSTSLQGEEIEGDPSHTANNLWPPLLAWLTSPAGAQDPSATCIILWKHTLRLLQLTPDSYYQLAQVSLQVNPVWCSLLHNQLLCIYTPSLEVHLLTLERVLAPSFDPKTVHAVMPLHAGILKDQRDTNYINKFKDKLEDESTELAMKLPFFQYFRNRSKEAHGEIQMLTDKGMMVYRQLPLDKVLEAYASKGKFNLALDLVTNIFEGRIPSTDAEKKATAFWTPQLVKGYLSQNIYEGQLTDEKSKVLGRCIDILLICGDKDTIFEDIKAIFPAKLFWEEVSKRVRSGEISSIPYDHLSAGLQYLDNEEVIRLLRYFDPRQHADDERAINKVLMIIKKKNIWPFLYRFCVFYPNQSIPLFLTMLAAEILMMDKKTKLDIIAEASWSNPDKIDLKNYFDDENRRVFFRIFWFFNLVLEPGELHKSLYHFGTDLKELETHEPDIYSKTLEWILDSNNAKIVADTSLQMFFELMNCACINTDLLNTKKVIELVKKIKNIYMKKSDQKPAAITAGTETITAATVESTQSSLRFIGSFRAKENLNHDFYPFCVVENIIQILDDILPTNRYEICFLALRSLLNDSMAKRYENQEWICYCLLGVMDQPFKEGRLWLNFKPVTMDKLEDMIIMVSGKLDSSKDILIYRKVICWQAIEKG